MRGLQVWHLGLGLGCIWVWVATGFESSHMEPWGGSRVRVASRVRRCGQLLADWQLRTLPVSFVRRRIAYAAAFKAARYSQSTIEGLLNSHHTCHVLCVSPAGHHHWQRALPLP
jgi:hypothetical protein